MIKYSVIIIIIVVRKDIIEHYESGVGVLNLLKAELKSPPAAIQRVGSEPGRPPSSIQAVRRDRMESEYGPN